METFRHRKKGSVELLRKRGGYGGDDLGGEYFADQIVPGDLIRSRDTWYRVNDIKVDGGAVIFETEEV